MTDLPISYMAPMVRALLADMKTQTRRTFTSLRGRHCRKITEFGRSDTRGYDWHFRDTGMRWHDLRHTELLPRLKYQVGDRLYLREHWRTDSLLDALPPRSITGRGTNVKYDADNFLRGSDKTWVGPGRFRHAMHMPRWASRLTLLVTDVRIERLQDISEADAKAEGVEVKSADPEWFGYRDYLNDRVMNPVAKGSYRTLWDSINGAGAWESNPWVTAYTFTVHRHNIDQVQP